MKKIMSCCDYKHIFLSTELIRSQLHIPYDWRERECPDVDTKMMVNQVRVNIGSSNDQIRSPIDFCIHLYYLDFFIFFILFYILYFIKSLSEFPLFFPILIFYDVIPIS